MSGATSSVLLVAESGEVGGIGRYCVDVAGLLGDRGSIACLCPSDCGRPGSCWLADACRARGIRLHQVPMPPKAWRSGLRGLVREWRRVGRPIVHVNGRRGNAVAMAARLGVRGWRYVTSVHGVLGLHDRRNALYRIVDVAAGRIARAVIAVSEDTYRKLLRAGIPRSVARLIPNALSERDLAAFRLVADERRATAPTRLNPLTVGFLGRLSPEKGTSELLRIARDIAAAGADARIVIGGDGPALGWLERETTELVARGVVTFQGPVADVTAFLRGVDVLVMPSHNEGLPYVLLEAMAAGCAVIAFDVGGIPEVVSAPTLGVLVPPGDVAGMVSQVIRLSTDRETVAALGQAASDHIRANFALPARWPLFASAYGFSLGGSVASASVANPGQPGPP